MQRMELPDEVLALIRAYAKPRFRYFREYNGVLKIMKKKEWPKLKQRLQKDPDSILPFLHTYCCALIKKGKLFQDMAYLRDETRYNLGFYRTRDAEDALWNLNRALR